MLNDADFIKCKSKEEINSTCNWAIVFLNQTDKKQSQICDQTH